MVDAGKGLCNTGVHCFGYWENLASLENAEVPGNPQGTALGRKSRNAEVPVDFIQEETRG